MCTHGGKHLSHSGLKQHLFDEQNSAVITMQRRKPGRAYLLV